MAKATKLRGRRTVTKKLAAKGGKLSKKDMKKVRGGRTETVGKNETRSLIKSA